MEEAMASTATAETLTEDYVTGKDTDSRNSNQETQTTEVSYESKIVHTHCPKFCNICVQTDDVNFLMKETFWLMMLRCIIILDLVTLIHCNLT